MTIYDFFVKLISNPDIAISQLITKYNEWVYIFLFLIIFAETGLIIASFLMPFLPGDALIFAIGLLSSKGELNIYIVIPLLIFAALLGDNLNYYIGRRFGSYLIKKEKILFLKQEYIDRATIFFQKNGKNSIIMARFVPVIRTIVPFLSGTTKVKYSVFLLYSFIGAVIWVGLISILGYNLGKIKWVQENLEYVIWGIILIANLPLLKQLFLKNKSA